MNAGLRRLVARRLGLIAQNPLKLYLMSYTYVATVAFFARTAHYKLTGSIPLHHTDAPASPLMYAMDHS